MSKAMRPVDFMRVKAAQNKNKTTKEICELYGYGRTTVDYMKRCKTFKEYKQRFCKSKKINNQEWLVVPVCNIEDKSTKVDIVVAVLIASVCVSILLFIMLLILGVF